MKCRKCGKRLNVGSQFCKACGEPVFLNQQVEGKVVSEPEKEKTRERNRKKIAIVLGAVCIILIIIVLFLMLQRQNKFEKTKKESIVVQTVSSTETMAMENIAKTTAISSELSIQTECDNVYFFDEGNLLTDSEFSKVFSELQNTADKIDMNIGVWIGTTEIGDGSDADTADFCDNQYDDRYGINTDGVFLYLDMSGASHLYDYISTSGKGQFYYTNSSQFNRISDIFASMNPYLKRDNEDLPSALHEFCDDLEYYAEKGAPSDTYYTYNRNNDKYLIMQDGKVKEVSELPEEYTIGD